MSTKTKQLVFSAAAIALATVISVVIKLPSLPNGGSVTLFSMLVITLIGYWYGPATGLLAAFAYGILQFITGPYVVHPVQVLLDYPLAFGALGLSGFFSKKKNGLLPKGNSPFFTYADACEAPARCLDRQTSQDRQDR